MKIINKVFIQLTLMSLMILISHVSKADEKVEIAKCSIIKDSIRRLECFDSLSKKSGLDKPAIKISSKGKWNTRTEQSKVDDSLSVFVSLDADSDISGWPEKSYRPSIILRCLEGKTEAMIVTGMPPQVEYGAYDSATVRLRIDKDKAFNEKMTESTDKEALFFRDSVKLIKKLMGNQTLLFQFTPFNSSSAITTFNITGIEEAIKPIRETCKW
ncbi:MAG: type VI secretion system-associated protein TagO [Methylotenera sp.]